MIKKLVYYAGGKGYLGVLSVVIFVGAFLRLYRLYDFVTFLGDQGRDAIVLKRLITFEHFPAIGAPTSVGAVFLGPFYYYFIAPWIALWQFDPAGPAYGVAVFSILSLVAQYFMVKDLLGRKTALISTVLSATAWVLIEPSRFSWNPNLLAQTVFFSVYCLIKSFRVRTLKWFALLGFFTAVSVQLHYLALVIIPAYVFFLILYYFRSGSGKVAVRHIAAAAATFFVMCIPLLVFDLRHDFLNVKNFVHLFSTPADVSRSGSAVELINAFGLFKSYFFEYEFHPTITLVSLIGLVLVGAKMAWHRSTAFVFVVVFFMLLIGTSLLRGAKHPHYFNGTYILFTVIAGYLLSHLAHRTIGWIIISLFLFSFIVLNARNYSFFHNEPNKQIQRAQRVARAIHNSVSADAYTVTSLPHQYSDSTYRYFLEVWDKRPIEKDSLEPAKELFVVCEEACAPIGNAQWDIAYFAPTKVLGTIPVDNVTVYKLGK